MSTNYPVFSPLFIFFVTCDFILLRPTIIINYNHYYSTRCQGLLHYRCENVIDNGKTSFVHIVL